MIGNYKDRRLSELMEAYGSGLYQTQEVISVCIDLLADEKTRNNLWSELPEWINVAIQQRLVNFDSADELVTFGHADPVDVKKQMAQLKHWLQESQRK